MNPRWLQYMPLWFAAYEVVITLFFVCFVSRSSISPSTFQRLHGVWSIAALGGGLGGIYWVVYHSFRMERPSSQILNLLFLGVILPIYGGFGLVAWVRPDWWQHFAESRERTRQWAREQKRENLRRTSERLRRFMGGPPSA